MNLPLRYAAASAAPATPPTLLCVDDETNGLLVRKMVLQSAGYSVLTAENGQAALELFAATNVDCVILDYFMPGMNGGVVATRMRRIRPQVPIILLSAYVSLPAQTLCTVDAYITKGQSPTLLLEQVRELLNGGGHHHHELDGELVAFVDEQRRFVGCTEPLCHMLGYTCEELLRLSIDDISDSSDVSADFQDYLQARGQEGLYRLKHKDGHQLLVRYKALVFPDGCLASRLEPVQEEAAA